MSRLLDRVASALDHRVSRRGFLARSALAGTAMAVAPTDYLLKPVGAYQAICSCAGSGCACGSMCCDGYTEFCCSMTGLNRCPPGHVLGGWWKVDNSSYCNDGPRYYMDCNAPCNGCGCGPNGVCSGSCSGTTCGCARNNCDLRRSGCVNFRYGQCNQATACIGPIVCRVVTCIPPWTLDASCTRTVAVDEYTRWHSAPCLYRPYGYLDEVSPAPGGVRLRGWAVDPESTAPITLHIYAGGKVVQWVTADKQRPDLAAVFPGIGTRHGFDTVVPLSAGRHTISVYAINVLDGSENPVIGSAPVGVGVPFGMADARVGPGLVRLTGWVIDPDTADPVQLHAYVDGVFAGQFGANVFRSDVAATYAAFGGEHGFDIELQVAAGIHDVELWFVQRNGRPFQLSGHRLTVSGGSAPVGYLDNAARSPNGIRVVGWAADPDSNLPLDIHVYVDGVFAGSTRADKSRPDVAGVFPAFGPNRGYDVEVPAQVGTRQVTVYAIGRGGGTPYRLLGTTTVLVANLPLGWFDAATDDPAGVRVRGWAVDPDAPGPVDLHVYVDGVFAGVGRTGRPRPDVAAAFSGTGADAGFDFVVPAEPGRRTVCVYAINRGDGLPTHPLFGCIPVTLS
jgi:hypothetical protein